MTEKRTMFVEVSRVGWFTDSIAVGFSRFGENGTWCGESIKLVVVHAEKDTVPEITEGLLDHGGDYRALYPYRALVVTENRTLYFESENNNIDNQALVTSLWTPEAISKTRNVYVALMGLDPVRDDTHAVAISIILAVQQAGTPEAFFQAACAIPKKKPWYRHLLDWCNG